MKNFQYIAQSLDGVEKQGQIQSKDKKSALLKLKEKGHLVLELKRVVKAPTLSVKSLAEFSRRLHLLLQSGLPVYESLAFLKEQATSKEKNVYESLGQKVLLGKSFSEALEEMQLFESLYLALIQSGEQRGNLQEALLVVSELIEQRQRLKRSILSALSYPLFIAVFAVVCFYILLLFVVPSFQSFFEGVELPQFTKFVFALSGQLQRHPLFIPLLAFLVGFGFLFTKPKKWIWRLPILNSLSLQRDLFLFSKAFSHLHDADVDLLITLDLTRDIVNHPKFKQRLSEMIEEVKSGRKLSECFAKLKLNVGFFVQMVKVGEQSANLSAAFKQISIYFDSILQYRIKRMLSFLQPIVLLIVAGFIGIIMLSILIPMTDVSRFVDL